MVHREQLVKAYCLLNGPSKHYLCRMTQTWGLIFHLRVYLETSGDSFVLSCWGLGVGVFSWHQIEARDAAKHPTMNRLAINNEELSSPNVLIVPTLRTPDLVHRIGDMVRPAPPSSLGNCLHVFPVPHS